MGTISKVQCLSNQAVKVVFARTLLEIHVHADVMVEEMKKTCALLLTSTILFVAVFAQSNGR